MDLAVGTLITPIGLSTISTSVSPGQLPLWLQRWQFLIKMDVCIPASINELTHGYSVFVVMIVSTNSIISFTTLLVDT